MAYCVLAGNAALQADLDRWQIQFAVFFDSAIKLKRVAITVGTCVYTRVPGRCCYFSFHKMSANLVAAVRVIRRHN